MKLKLFLIVFIVNTISLYANDCEKMKLPFETNNKKYYVDICNSLVKEKIPLKYIFNNFDYKYNKKINEIDNITLKVFSGNKKIKKKIANNELKANIYLKSKIEKLNKNLIEYKDIYDLTKKDYKVHPEVMAAIMYKETKFGKILGKHDAFVTANTMLRKLDEKKYKNYLKMSRSSLIHLIKYNYKHNIDINKKLVASYAGAIGIPQFMPFNLWLVKSYKNKIPNLMTMEDAIPSIGNYIKYKCKNTNMEFKWKSKKKWNNFINKWNEINFKHSHIGLYKNNKYYTESFYENYKDKKFLNEIKPEIKCILKYNNSYNYAIGVLDLAYTSHYNK
jgi:membrane-bound lytic murein transglycosylase B